VEEPGEGVKSLIVGPLEEGSKFWTPSSTTATVTTPSMGGTTMRRGRGELSRLETEHGIINDHRSRSHGVRECR